MDGKLSLTSVTEYPEIQKVGGWSELKPFDPAIFASIDLEKSIEEFKKVPIITIKFLKY